jgi:hypothetical protein
MSALRVAVTGIGLCGPGLTSWAAAVEVLGGLRPRDAGATVLPVPARLPAAERRRAGSAVKLALAVADEAVARATLDPSTLATVFTSSSGEGSHCHALCETLASSTPMVSPTRFANSVHNAAAGCWHIAVQSRAPSTSLCGYDGSFGAGMIEAAVDVRVIGMPMLLVASDSPYPEPLHATRPLPDHFGVAFVLAPEPAPDAIAHLAIELVVADVRATACEDAGLEAMRRAIPAAAALPLLIALARRATGSVVLDYLPETRLRIELG